MAEQEFKPFQKCLMRETDWDPWRPVFFSHTDPRKPGMFWAISWQHAYFQCIPYEGNEYLAGTSKKLGE